MIDKVENSHLKLSLCTFNVFSLVFGLKPSQFLANPFLECVTFAVEPKEMNSIIEISMTFL